MIPTQHGILTRLDTSVLRLQQPKTTHSVLIQSVGNSK